VAKKSKIPSFDDLIFESRNREYGAYQLRKKYISNLITGVLVSIVVGSSAVIIPFTLTSRNEEFVVGGGRFVSLQMESLRSPKEVQLYVPPPPPAPKTESAEANVKYVPPEVVDTIFDVKNLLAATDDVLARSEGELTDMGNTGYGDDLFEGETGYGSDEPFIMVEVMPSFKGGDINKFRDYIQKRTNYPQEAIDKKIQGRVFLTFIVETDGSVSNVTVVKGVDPLIDNEAVKAIQSSPNWSPGLQRGQPVRVRFSMSLAFIN
jgi:protein TonB